MFVQAYQFNKTLQNPLFVLGLILIASVLLVALASLFGASHLDIIAVTGGGACNCGV